MNTETDTIPGQLAIDIPTADAYWTGEADAEARYLVGIGETAEHAELLASSKTLGRIARGIAAKAIRGEACTPAEARDFRAMQARTDEATEALTKAIIEARRRQAAANIAVMRNA